jgi:hypothetical protein
MTASSRRTALSADDFVVIFAAIHGVVATGSVACR